MKRRTPLLTFLTWGVTVILVTSFAAPRKVGSPDSNESAVEKYYVPFDSIKTDMEDYAWPTSARPIITSSFAEFRSSHLHAGIDISTGNKPGARVYASRDGFVTKVSTSPYGYGRHIVLRHRDGFSTVYAHLKSFNEELEGEVHAEQLRQQKYSVELQFAPQQRNVQKGDFLGFSGESGSGKAHLHFEIRDENYNPINPLLFPGIAKMYDQIPPVFMRLAVTPLDERSRVEHEFDAKVFRARRKSRSSYSITEVIRGTGTLGFEVDVVDKSNFTTDRSSVHFVEFEVDGKTVFSSRKDRFPEEQAGQVGLDYDWRLLKEGKGRFQKLFIDAGNILPFYDRRNKHEGAISLSTFPEGLHNFRILASDFAGNRSELKGMLVLNHPPKIEITGMKDGTLSAYLPDPERVTTIELATRKLASSKWEVRELAAPSIIAGDGSIAIPLRGKREIVRLVAKNKWGTRSYPVFWCPERKAGNASVKISSDIIGCVMKLSAHSEVPFSAPPSMQIQQGDSVSAIPLVAASPTAYTGTFRMSDTFSGTSRVKVFCSVGGKQREVFSTVHSVTVTPEKGGTVLSEDGRFSVTFPPEAVFSPQHVWIEKTGPARYCVYPTEAVIRGDLTVLLQYAENQDEDPTLSLYVNAGGGWKIAPAERSEEKFILRGAHTLGTYGIFSDTQKPTISRWRTSSRNGSAVPIFSFSTKDNFAGVDPDGISVFLNNERVIPEYDPERHRVFYFPYEPLPRGRYRVTIKVSDRVGNSVHATKSLTVLR